MYVLLIIKNIPPNTSFPMRFLSFSLLALAAVILFVSHKDSRPIKPELPMMQSFSATPRFENEVEIFGQKVDLSRWDMHERYERELTNMCYTHNSTLLTIKRANRLFPILCPILKEEEVPEDFIYLCCIESSLNIRALSPAKAAGLWQFMPETGKQFGLQIDAEVDERYHIEKATHAACKYFKQAYNKFGDWIAVAAAYNAGQGGINKRLNDQRQKSVFDILMVEETSRYVFRIMAMKEILRDPYHYGFVLYSDQLYRPIKTHEHKVKGSIANLADYAVNLKTSYYQLKEFNPWLRDNKLTVRPGKEYTLLLPDEDDMYYDRHKFKVYDEHWAVDL